MREALRREQRMDGCMSEPKQLGSRCLYDGGRFYLDRAREHTAQGLIYYAKTLLGLAPESTLC